MSLKDIPGIKYDLEYENLLELIPFSEFEIRKDEEPMKGSRGVVYKALWKRPQKIAQPPRDDVWVVLKTVEVKSEDELDPIFKELDINFNALQGSVASFTKFYGVTCSPERLPPENPFGEQTENKIFLVIECALLGSAEDYLREKLTGDTFDWDLLLRFIWNIATGLNVLHKNRVVHRDLHWGNLLITTNKDRKDLLTSVKSIGENTEILIADLGEGKVAGGTSTIGRKYGPPKFRAPEIEFSNAEYTSSADMYSMGQLTKDIVRWYWDAAERQGDLSHLIPKAVQDLIKNLVESADPKDRLSAEEAVRLLQEVWGKGMDNYDFRPERIGLVEYDEGDGNEEIPF